MIRRVFGVMAAFVAVILYFTFHVDEGDSKALLIKEADVIAVAKVNLVITVSQPGSSLDDYKFRADVQVEKAIKGSPPKSLVMYSNGKTCGDTATFGPGRALIFLKKDKRDNYLVFRRFLSVMPIGTNDKLFWSKDNSFNQLSDLSLGDAISDIEREVKKGS